MIQAVVGNGKKYLGADVDSEISELIQPGEAEVFLSEGVQHLAEDSQPKKFANGCATPIR
jgi:hypothetical protein